MSRPLAAALGILSVVPFVYVVYFISVMSSHADRTGRDDLSWIIPLHIGAMLLNVVLIVIYLVIAYRSEAVPNDKRAFWAIVLLMGNLVAFPLFWYLHLWRRLPSKGSGAF